MAYTDPGRFRIRPPFRPPSFKGTAMMRAASAALFLLLGVLPGRAQDPNRTYDLKFESPPRVGQKVEWTKTENQDMKINVLLEGKVVQKQETSASFSFAAVSEVLEVAGKKMARMKVTFSKAVRTTNGVEASYGFAGKTVLVRRGVDGKAVFAYESGDPLTGTDLEGARKAVQWDDEKKSEPSGAEIFAPKKPVRAGESWSPDLPLFAKMLAGDTSGLAFDMSKSIGSFTLRSVEKRAGAEFGKIDGSFLLALTSMGPLKLNSTVPFRADFKIDACIDGSIPDGVMNGTMSVKGKSTTKPPGGQAVLGLDIDMKFTQVMKRTSAR